MFSNRDMQLRKIIETLALITGMALLCQSCKDRELKEYDFPNCYEIDLNTQQPELSLSQSVDSVAEIVLTFPEDVLLVVPVRFGLPEHADILSIYCFKE